MRFEGKIKLSGNIEKLKEIKELISLEKDTRHNDRKFPGIWLQWEVIEKDNDFFIVWDENEKFQNSAEWMVWIVHTILIPNEIIANGTIYRIEYFASETGCINVADNIVSFLSLEELTYEFFN